MQDFDSELEKLVRSGEVTVATALLFASNAGNLRLQLSDVPSDETDLIVR